MNFADYAMMECEGDHSTRDDGGVDEHLHASLCLYYQLRTKHENEKASVSVISVESTF